MDAILKSFIYSHLFMIVAVLLLSNGPEGLLLLPIAVFWGLFELSLITGLLNQLSLNEKNKGSFSLWVGVILTSFLLIGQLTS